MLGFIFVQEQDVNRESLKHGEINSYVVYVYDVSPDTGHSTVRSGER